MRRTPRWLAACLLWLPLGGVAADEPARVAIIIDDLGNSLDRGREAVALPAAVTYSVLPLRPYSRRIAELAHLEGKEVMLHLPMQAMGRGWLGPAGLHDRMERADVAAALQLSLDGVPHVAGVNNHMGSRLTQQPQAMRWLMESLRCAGDLYFVDSRTDVRTVARHIAREVGLPNAERDVFLDNEIDAEYVRSQFERLIRYARRHGSAIGIAHPHPETLAALAQLLPLLADQGVEVVPVSQLVERRNPPKWHACSSPLQTAAKRSRPLPSSICCGAPASRSSPPD
jgi:polysaccharide deacetylase 2 family uncharacterized protein YibQ